MFDALDRIDRGQRQEDQDEERRLQFMAQNPDQARARMSYEMAGLAGKGLAQAGSAMAGLDPRSRTERDVDNVTAAKAAIAELPEVDLSKPEGVDAYYKGVIGALRKHNLPAEAHAASVEWNKERNALTDRQIKIDDLDRKKAADKVTADEKQRKLQIAQERNNQLAQRGMPEMIQIIDRIEKEEDPATRELLTKHANALIESKKKGVILENLGNRVVVRDKATGAVIGTPDLMGEKPLSAKDAAKSAAGKEDDVKAYRADMQGLQTVYKAAADLYNSPGLDELIGKWTGIAAEQGPEKGGPFREMFIARLGPRGQEALGLFQQVQGASFIKALKDLKAAGKGSTGLGAVSEVEGNKIQAANGALFPRQQPESFRRKLAAFIDTIEASANNLATEAMKDKIEPIHLNTVPLTGPGRRGAPPAEAPTRPAGGQSGEPTVTMTKDGKTRQVYRSKVEEAKRRGYTETK
jgi:hypothetical protein